MCSTCLSSVPMCGIYLRELWPLSESLVRSQRFFTVHVALLSSNKQGVITQKFHFTVIFVSHQDDRPWSENRWRRLNIKKIKRVFSLLCSYLWLNEKAFTLMRLFVFLPPDWQTVVCSEIFHRHETVSLMFFEQYYQKENIFKNAIMLKSEICCWTEH